MVSIYWPTFDLDFQAQPCASQLRGQAETNLKDWTVEKLRNFPGKFKSKNEINLKALYKTNMSKSYPVKMNPIQVIPLSESVPGKHLINEPRIYFKILPKWEENKTSRDFLGSVILLPLILTYILMQTHKKYKHRRPHLRWSVT